MHSIGPLYASRKIIRWAPYLSDNAEWMASNPAYNKISNPHGLEDNVKIGKPVSMKVEILGKCCK